MSSLLHSRARHFALAAVTLLLLLIADRASAQWSIRANIGPGAHFVKMMDEVGEPHIGYIGREQGGMLRTIDTGFTWTEVTFDPNSRDEIFDIVFKDAVIGFAAGLHYAYKSVDSGKTWSIMSNIQGRGIHYMRSTHTLLISSWTGGAQASTDDGATWYTFSSPEMNGFTYLDDYRAMFTPHAGQAKFTTDGGASWETCNMSIEVYQPAAMRGHGYYVGVSESTHKVMRSTDGGYNWTIMDHMYNPTGCVRGNDNNLIAQTRSGMMRSTNQGVSWNFICGPSNSYDTRFWVRGLEIFAMSSTGLLYYNPKSTPGTLNHKLVITPDPLRLNTDGCNTPTGEIKISTDVCGVQLTAASISGDDELELEAMSLPADMNSSVTVPVIYKPIGIPDEDSAIIYLRIDVGGLIVDTFVKVYGRTTPAIVPAVTPWQVSLSMSPIDCKVDEQQVAVHNQGCDQFRIDSFHLSDPVHFSVSGLNVPILLASKGVHPFTVFSTAANVKKVQGVLLIYVSNTAGAKILRVTLELNRVGPALKPMEDKKYLFNTTCDPITSSVDFANLTCDTIFVDSVKLSNTKDFQLLPLGFPQVLLRDQSLTIPYEVIAPRPGPASSRLQVYLRTMGTSMQQVTYLFSSTTVKVVLPADTVKFIADGSCPEFKSDFDVTNILCDPIKIISLKPLFQPQFTLTLPTLPLELKTNETATIGVATNTFFVGTTGTSIVMRYEAYGKTYDTIIHVAVRNQKTFSIDPKLSRVNFGRISVCAPQQRTIYIDNRYCIPVTIDRLRLSAATSNRFTIEYQPIPQRVLAPGERDSLVLLFAPDAIGSRIGAVELRLKSAIVTLDTFFTVEGIGTGSVNANIRDEELSLGEALTCQRLEQTTVIRNDGCVDLKITGVSPLGGKFDLVSPALPYDVAPGDSVTLTFEVVTVQPGVHNQNVTIRLVSAQNVEQLIDCKLSATLNVEAPRFLVPPLVLGQLNGCQPFDTNIVVRNPLLCDPIEMTADFTSPDATIVGPNTAIIPPGRFFMFALRIDPNTAGSVGLRLRSATVDTTIPITYTFVGGGGETTLSGPTQVLKTNACDAVYDTLFITTGDCHGEMVDFIRIVPVGGTATRFSLATTFDFPLYLSVLDRTPIPVRFDPKAQGVNSALVEVGASGLTKTFQLNGDFIPVGTLGASLTSAGMKQVVVGDEFDVDVTLSASLPMPVAINDLFAEFSYDSDLLTLVSVTPQDNWILKGQETESNLAELTFSHPSSTFGVNMPLARLTFRTAIARDKTGTIKLKGLLVNSGDPRFSECVASTVFHETSNDAGVTYFCGAETLRNALNGKLPLSNIIVQPHPASAADRTIKVSFDAERDSEVDIELVNVLGVTATTVKINATSGHNELQLPLNGAGKGWHLLRLKTSLGVAGIRVLLTD